MLEWLIIGGGIHGTAISHYLKNRKRVESVRVLDPHNAPLALWKHFTANVGLPYLRSPLVHHLHYDPWSPRTFAQTRHGAPLAKFIPLYERPSLTFFNTYSDQLIDRYGLDDLRLQGRANGLERLDHGWRVLTAEGDLIDSRLVVLAMGASEQLNIPTWARNVPRIHHLFAPDFNRADLPPHQHIAVIGGGISAAQVSIALADAGHQVTMIARHDLRVSHFDSDPCWVTQLCLDDFHAEPDFDKRREMIKRARRPGSMPPDVLARLDDSIDAGRVRLRFDAVESAQANSDGAMLALSRESLAVDYVLLATGFEAQRPGGAWLDEAIQQYGFPLASDGYPVVDNTLCWSEGVYVSGALAELEIGPTARNIIGARLAAERIGRVNL